MKTYRNYFMLMKWFQMDCGDLKKIVSISQYKPILAMNIQLAVGAKCTYSII